MADVSGLAKSVAGKGVISQISHVWVEFNSDRLPAKKPLQEIEIAREIG